MSKVWMQMVQKLSGFTVLSFFIWIRKISQQKMSSMKLIKLYLKGWMANQLLSVQWTLVETKNFLTLICQKKWIRSLDSVLFVFLFLKQEMQCSAHNYVHFCVHLCMDNCVSCSQWLLCWLNSVLQKAFWKKKKLNCLQRVWQLRTIFKLVSWLKFQRQQCLLTNLQKKLTSSQLVPMTWFNTQWLLTVWMNKFLTCTNHTTLLSFA